MSDIRLLAKSLSTFFLAKLRTERFFGKQVGFGAANYMAILSSGHTTLYLLPVFFFDISSRMHLSQKVWPHMVRRRGGLRSVKSSLHFGQRAYSSVSINILI